MSGGNAPHMTTRSLILSVVAVASILPTAPADAQTRARLPIPEGFWVDANKSCGAAQEVYVYKGNQFGSISENMGSSLDRMDRVEASGAGFVRYFGEIPGGLRIGARPNGQAVIQGSRYSTGEVFWSITARQCAPESLPAGIRAQAQRLGVLQGAASSPAASASRSQPANSVAAQRFTLQVTLSPAVQAYIRRVRKPLTIEVIYTGEPKPRFASRADAETGYLPLGNESVPLPSTGGAISLGSGLDRSQLPMLAKPAEATISFLIGQYHTGENELRCTGLGPRVSEMQQHIITLNELGRAPRSVACDMPGPERR
jgi:hypothetical protein